MNNRKLFASLMLVLATLSWGFSYTVQSLSAESVGPFTVVFFKGIGGILVFPLIIRFHQHFSKETFLGGMLIGVFAFAGCVLQQYGIAASTVSKASFITVLYIVFVPLIQAFLGKKAAGGLIFSVILALLGLYFLCINGEFILQAGDVYLLLCSLCFAFQIILIDHFARKCDTLPLTLVSQLSIALLSLIMALRYETISWPAISEVLLPLLYIVLISGMAAQTIQIVFQKDVDATLASLLMSMESVFGAFFGWLILHQSLSFREAFGCILVLIAVIMAELV